MLKKRLAQALPILAVVAIAGWARFSGLDTGLRHPPHTDERVYVENVVAMVEAGDLDHRFYTYPGLFYYLLAPGVWLLGPELWHGPDAYLVSRGLVAAVGVLNCLLIFIVGRRLLGHRAALIAAALLAVSPVEVKTCHEVRPDILLQAFGIVGLLLLERATRVSSGFTPPDLRMGLLTGCATAVKFTGVLMWPSYLLARLWSTRAAPLRLIAACVLVPVGVLVFTPYALINAARYKSGPPAQLAMYYQGEFAGRFLTNAAYYFWDIVGTVGLVACLAICLGVFQMVRDRPRLWVSALLHPLLVVLVMSTAKLVFPRLVIPGLAVVYLAAGVGIAWVARSTPRQWLQRALLALGLVAVVWGPGRTTLAYVLMVRQPSIADRALDWITRDAMKPSLVLESRREARPGARPGIMVGVSAPHEIIYLSADEDRWGLRRLAEEADYIITGPQGGRWTMGLPELVDLFELGHGPEGLRIRRVRSRPDYVDLPATAIADGTPLRTVRWEKWVAGESLEKTRVPETIELTIPPPHLVARIELVGVVGDATPEIGVATPAGELRSILGRPPLDRQEEPKSLPVLITPSAAPKLVLRIQSRGEVWIGGVVVRGLAASHQ